MNVIEELNEGFKRGDSFKIADMLKIFYNNIGYIETNEMTLIRLHTKHISTIVRLLTYDDEEAHKNTDAIEVLKILTEKQEEFFALEPKIQLLILLSFICNTTFKTMDTLERDTFEAMCREVYDLSESKPLSRLGIAYEMYRLEYERQMRLAQKEDKKEELERKIDIF